MLVEWWLYPLRLTRKELESRVAALEKDLLEERSKMFSAVNDERTRMNLADLAKRWGLDSIASTKAVAEAIGLCRGRIIHDILVNDDSWTAEEVQLAEARAAAKCGINAIKKQVKAK